MNRAFFRIGVSALALFAAQQATAEGFYIGAGIEAGSGDLEQFSADFKLQSASVIAGYRFAVNDQFFVGGEVETSLGTGYDLDGFTGESVDRLSRLRLLAGYDFGSYALFGAIGGAKATGDIAFGGSGFDFDGTTIGLGGEFSVGDRMDIRLEAIRDSLEGSDGFTNYDWDNTSIRAAAIFKF